MNDKPKNSLQMKSYLIKSLAPLVFRSGKPFGSQASAQDVIFPLPSAGAGLVRALTIGQNITDFSAHRAQLTDADYQKLLSIKAGGVYLLRLYDDGRIEVLLPKPANALYLEDLSQLDDKGNGKTTLVRLSPQPFSNGCGSDLPAGLLPLQMDKKELQGKPQSGANFWTLEHVLAWLQGNELSYEEVNDRGLKQLPVELRTHVAIDDDTLANVDTALFQTASFDLAHQQKSKGSNNKANASNYQGWQDHRYAFMVRTEQQLATDLATFGGERRLSVFEPVDVRLTVQDDNQLLADINKSRGFCLTFITPAIFNKGYLPSWIDKDSKQDVLQGTLPNSDVEVRLIACAIDRWQAISGWDSLLWAPKAMRKAVCAGSVYWFELLNEMDSNTLKRLQQSLSDATDDQCQDQRDGFGMALVTAWTT